MVQKSPITILYTSGLNNQLIHHCFGHQCMGHILEKKERIMEGMLTNISKFYDKYTCPICLFTKVARIPRNKITYEIAYKNGEVLCLDYPFWNATSI